ncbi:hypothetical protein CR513_24621, partial [Mucuna pruriens]
MAKVLKVPKSEILRQKKNRNGVEGILETALEERLQQLQEEEDWSAFVNVYGLLVYGIILFPQIEHYVDLTAIDAFLGRRDWGEHPVVVVLANTYYTLDYCSMRNGKGLRCYTTLLFLWLTVHLFHSSKKTSYVKLLTKVEWTACLDEATEILIWWYSQWNERDDVIIYCGGFLNVPLMGTKGAINCNPNLTLHQAGYLMVLPPSEEAVTPFILHGLGIQEGEQLKKICQAWKKTIRKGHEWRLRSCGASSSYKSWLQHKTNAAVTTLVNMNVVGYAQNGYAHNVRDPPYGMPHGWNIENAANEDSRADPNPKEDSGAQHQTLGNPPPFVVHKQASQTKEKWQSLEERLHAIEGGDKYRLEAIDLCLVLDVGLLTDFKTPEFDKYKGSSCPRVHLAMYCRKMAAYIYDDKVLIHYFQDSLTGTALSWYVALERGRIKT